MNIRKSIFCGLLISIVLNTSVWADRIADPPKLLTGAECDAIKTQKITGTGIIVISSHADGKGLIYTHEPYKLYRDGCLVQQQLTNEKGEVVFDYTEEAMYVLDMILLGGPRIAEPARVIPNKK